MHALLRRLLNQAVRWGWLAVNPVSKATPPRVDHYELHPPSPSDVLQLIEAADERDPDVGCFLRMLAATGARRGEVCALRWSDLDEQAGTVRISRSVIGVRADTLVEKDNKTHAARKVSLDKITLTVLHELRKRCTHRAEICGASLSQDAFMFSGDPDRRTPWRPKRVTLAFGRLCMAVGVENVRLHDLRHFAATQMLAAGVPVKTVSGRLGHAKASTTLDIYAHVLASSDEEAAAVLGTVLTPAGPALSGKRHSRVQR